MGVSAMTSGPRPVRAARGTELTAQGWPQEAAYRMLQNNLDPEVAERRGDLVVYGGTGKAALGLTPGKAVFSVGWQQRIDRAAALTHRAGASRLAMRV